MTSLDDPNSLTPVLKKLGVRHLIYGVEQRYIATISILEIDSRLTEFPLLIRNFQSWGLALAKTLESVLGSDLCTRETKEAWFLLVQGLSSVMMQDYEQIRDGYSGKLFKRENNSWRLYEVVMTHERLSLYKDAERTKLKEEIWLNLIDDIELIPMHTDGTKAFDIRTTTMDRYANHTTSDPPDAANFPTQYAFRLSAGGALRVDLCALSETQLLHWMDDITERIRAHQRAQPSTAEDPDSESLASSISDRDNLEEDLEQYELATHEQGDEPHQDSSNSEDSDDNLEEAEEVAMLSDDDDDELEDKKFSFVGFTGIDSRSKAKQSSASTPDRSKKGERKSSGKKDDFGLPPRAPESALSAPASPAATKKKNWRTRAEKKIKKLQASLQIKNANKQRPLKPSGSGAKVM
jgi:hypothetical protein